jgi:hypothetical protein
MAAGPAEPLEAGIGSEHVLSRLPLTRLAPRIVLCIASVLGLATCGDRTQNCAPPCWWLVKVRNETRDVVYFALNQDPPLKTTPIQPGAIAHVNYVMPQHGDLSAQFLYFLALDASDKPVFCRRVPWSELKSAQAVAIRPGELQC